MPRKSLDPGHLKAATDLEEDWQGVAAAAGLKTRPGTGRGVRAVAQNSQGRRDRPDAIADTLIFRKSGILVAGLRRARNRSQLHGRAVVFRQARCSSKALRCLRSICAVQIGLLSAAMQNRRASGVGLWREACLYADKIADVDVISRLEQVHEQLLLPRQPHDDIIGHANP
jgi:hypothetical protein